MLGTGWWEASSSLPVNTGQMVPKDHVSAPSAAGRGGDEETQRGINGGRKVCERERGGHRASK